MLNDQMDKFCSNSKNPESPAAAAAAIVAAAAANWVLGNTAVLRDLRMQSCVLLELQIGIQDGLSFVHSRVRPSVFLMKV